MPEPATDPGRMSHTGHAESHAGQWDASPPYLAYLSCGYAGELTLPDPQQGPTVSHT